MLIKWTKTALRSVDEIAGYIAKDNPARATSFVLELQQAVTKLQATLAWAGLAASPARVNWSCTRTTSPFTACVAMTLKF